MCAERTKSKRRCSNRNRDSEGKHLSHYIRHACKFYFHHMRTIFQLYLTSFLSLKVCVTRSVISSLRSYFANWLNIDRKWPLSGIRTTTIRRSWNDLKRICSTTSKGHFFNFLSGYHFSRFFYLSRD